MNIRLGSCAALGAGETDILDFGTKTATTAKQLGIANETMLAFGATLIGGEHL